MAFIYMFNICVYPKVDVYIVIKSLGYNEIFHTGFWVTLHFQNTSGVGI